MGPLSGTHLNVLALWQTRENSISDPLNDPGAKFAERPRTQLPGGAHTVQLLSSKLPPNTVHADSVDTTCHSIAVEQGVTDEWCTDHCSPHDCALSVCCRSMLPLRSPLCSQCRLSSFRRDLLLVTRRL